MDSQQRPPRRPTRGTAARPRSGASRTRPPAGASHALPVLPVRNVVMLPQSFAPLLIEDDRTRRAIEAAQASDGLIFAVTQRVEHIEHPTPEDLFTVGVEAAIVKTDQLPDGTLSVMIRSLRRATIVEFHEGAPYLCADIAVIAEPRDTTIEVAARLRLLRHRFEQVIKHNTRIAEDAYPSVMSAEEPGMVADIIAMSLDLDVAQRQSVLEAIDPAQRLALVDGLLIKELALLEMEARIQQGVQHEMDRGQREYYLREQIKVIQRELAEHDPALRDGLELRDRIMAAGMPDEARERALREMERLESMPSMAPEFTVVRTYLDWLLALPWHQRSPERHDLVRAALTLDANHYGLQKIKDRLIEFLAVRKMAPDSRSPILCFAGPPGVGKTSLGQSIAEALGRKFARVSLGGVRDEAEVRGHRRTYVGALPGRIIQTMRQAGTINPVFVLDEIDKLASDYRGDPASALLEVLDPEQNHTFSDHYLEVAYDLSKVIFILTANTLTNMPAALLDRMEVIEVPGYTEEEKARIARDFLLPKRIKEHGLTPARIEIKDEAVRRVIREYTHEAGVRNLERELSAVVRKVTRRVAEGKRGKTTISAGRVPEYLGPPRAFANEAETEDQVGLAMGVAWTAAGGELTPVEIAVVAGRGQITLTGSLGEVLRESAHAAVTYARSRAVELRLPANFHEQSDIHIHLPSGAVHKDGPSAGVPIALALISALTGRAVRHDVAMTGEITLRGRVMPIGGLKEKSLAAHRAGLRRLLLPRRNLGDLEDVPPEVRSALEFIPLDTLDDAVRAALVALPGERAMTLGKTPPEVAAPEGAPLAALGREPRDEIASEVARPVEKPNVITGTPREPARPVIIGVN